MNWFDTVIGLLIGGVLGALATLWFTKKPTPPPPQKGE